MPKPDGREVFVRIIFGVNFARAAAQKKQLIILRECRVGYPSWVLSFAIFGIVIKAYYTHKPSIQQGFTQMLTRRRQKKEDKEAIRATRRLFVRFSPPLFLNPSKIYKIFDNFYLDEDMLSEDVSEIDNLSGVLNWNRITSGTITNDYLQFDLRPISRQFELPAAYVIDRLRSFGKVPLFNVANCIEQLLSCSRGLTPEESSYFIPEAQVLARFAEKPYFMVAGEVTADTSRLTRIYISRYVCNEIDISEDELVHHSVRQGCLPLKMISTTAYYVDTCQRFLQLMGKYFMLARGKNAEGIRRMSDMAKSDVKLQLLSTSSNIRGRCQVSIQIFSPVDVVFEFKEIELETYETSTRSSSVYLEEQELEIARHLMPVPREKLRDYRKKICKYRMRELHSEHS